MTMLQPNLKWAQRKDKLFLTVDLQDCQISDVKVSNEDGCGKFEFRGTAQDNQYELTLALMAEVDPDNAKIAKTPRNIFVMVPKKESGDHWPRLTKEKGKQNHILVDWSHYIDQDDEEAGSDYNAPGEMPENLDMSKLAEMVAGQSGGGPSEDSDDDDDGDLPDLQ